MNPVIFTHVPKACGTTLIKLLHRWHPKEEIYEVGLKSRAEQMADLRAQPGIRLVLGHAAFGLHEALAAPARYITVLRDPVARVISQFHYTSRTPQHPLYARIKSGEMDLFAMARHVENLQTRYLSGRFEGRADGQTLALAKENIAQHYSVAGLTERFDETVVLLHRVFARRLRPFASENVGTRRAPAEELSPGQLRELRACNELDYELYDFVRARFEQQIAQQDETFARRVARLQFGNRVADFAVRTLRRVRTGGRK